MINVTHYSDALCIWAYISEIRIAELEAQFGRQVNIDYRFMPVFGDVPGKMTSQWANRGGAAGYAAHVHDIAARFDHIDLHPDTWQRTVPTSSLPAHLLLCAARVAAQAGHERVDAAAVARLLHALRRAFFTEARDISSHAVLREVMAGCEIDMDALTQALDNGTAHAALAADIAAARETGIKASPTLVLNEGRQMLAGNVGYRVIEANIRELLEAPGDQQSWC